MTSREKLTFVLVHGAFHDGSAYQQHGPAASGDRVIQWVDLHTGPITWQIRDQAGLHSVTEILHSAYISAIAVFPDGAQHQDDPMSTDRDTA
jgi:hypothetical protein